MQTFANNLINQQAGQFLIVLVLVGTLCTLAIMGHDPSPWLIALTAAWGGHLFGVNAALQPTPEPKGP